MVGELQGARGVPKSNELDGLHSARIRTLNLDRERCRCSQKAPLGQRSNVDGWTATAGPFFDQSKDSGSHAFMVRKSVGADTYIQGIAESVCDYDAASGAFSSRTALDKRGRGSQGGLYLHV